MKNNTMTRREIESLIAWKKQLIERIDDNDQWNEMNESIRALEDALLKEEAVV